MRVSFNKYQLEECKRALKYYCKIQKQSVLVYGEEFIEKTATANRLYKLIQHLQPNEELDYADDVLDFFKKAFNLYLLNLKIANQERREKYIKQCINLIGENNGI